MSTAADGTQVKYFQRLCACETPVPYNRKTVTTTTNTGGEAYNTVYSDIYCKKCELPTGNAEGGKEKS